MDNNYSENSSRGLISNQPLYMVYLKVYTAATFHTYPLYDSAILGNPGNECVQSVMHGRQYRVMEHTHFHLVNSILWDSML